MPRTMSANRYFSAFHPLIAAAALGAGLAGCKRDTGDRIFPEKEHRFGEVLQGKEVVYSFPVHNRTERDVVIRRIGTANGATVLHADSVIRPGERGTIRVSVATNRRGPIDGLANVYTESLDKPVASLHLKGTVVFPIEVTPRRQAYFFTVKGEPAAQVLSLVNHSERPVRVTGVKSDNRHFEVRSETVQSGRRYKLTVTLDSATPPGKHDGRVTVATDSPQFPEIIIPSFAQVKDSLSTSLDTVHFRQIQYAQLDNRVIGRKTVMVTKHRAKDFRLLSATTDLPFLDVEVRPHKPGESFLLELRIVAQRAKRGRVAGTLYITTNDPSRPELRLPIRGNIV
jgi:hypothetical protein